MISQSGTFYKIIVTSWLFLGVNQLSLSHASPVTSKQASIIPGGVSHATFNLQYPPSAPTGTGLFFTAGDIAAAESGSFFGDGALVSHPLHGILPGGSLDFLNVETGGNQFMQALVSPQQADDLQTAGQSYFIEPPTPTTTTQKPTFKKRKTRRPISSLAEKSKKSKAAEVDNSANNEVFQGNPVPFNPFRQIVNTSFGRKRPSDNNQERPRSRANAVNNQGTGSADETNSNEQKSSDVLNEIPRSEGEPRALGRRRPAPDIRPIRPTTTVASEDGNGDDVPKGRRFPLRKPRPSFDATTISPQDDNENANQTPVRPRKLIKRPRPRPTTTISAPQTETDTPTETTDPFTVSQPFSTRPPHFQAAQLIDTKPRVRPVRPLAVSRFANSHRFAVTTTPRPSASEEDSPVPSTFSPRRRPLRPTTRQQSLTTSTEAPEDILKNLVSDASPTPVTGRGRGYGSQKPLREGRKGFLLRPRPTPNDESSTDNADGQVTQNEVGLRKPLSNRRRKRPTTTDASQVAPAVSYNQGLVGGIVESNVHTAPARAPQGRRVPQGIRTRVTPVTGGAYQVREEEPVSVPVQQGQSLRSTTGEFFSQQGNSGSISNPLLRRPVGPAQPSAVAPPSPLQNSIFHNNAGVEDSSNFVNPNSNFFRVPSQESLGFYPSGLDNVLGVPSNYRAIQQMPGATEFSSRSTSTLDEPEISNNDFSSAASTEKQAISSNTTEIANTPASSTEAAPQNKQENEQKKVPPTKLSPLERLQQNRQAAARRLLSRKPTEKTTETPTSGNQKTGKNFRKSIIPPRMLRPRGKLPSANTIQQQEQTVPEDGRENDSVAADEKSNNNESGGTNSEIINDSASSAAETDKDSNTIAISPNPKEEEKVTSTRKPSILEAAKRRRASTVLSKNAAAVAVPQPQILKITPAPPPNHDPEAPPPTCENGQRYSKFLKRCVTMYKPKAQG